MPHTSLPGGAVVPLLELLLAELELLPAEPELLLAELELLLLAVPVLVVPLPLLEPLAPPPVLPVVELLASPPWPVAPPLPVLPPLKSNWPSTCVHADATHAPETTSKPATVLERILP